MLDPTEAWDCDPFTTVTADPLYVDRDEDDEGDWQFIVLDRFHDRLVKGELR